MGEKPYWFGVMKRQLHVIIEHGFVSIIVGIRPAPVIRRWQQQQQQQEEEYLPPLPSPHPQPIEGIRCDWAI